MGLDAVVYTLPQHRTNEQTRNFGPRTAKSVFSSHTWMILLNAFPLHVTLSLSVLFEKLV